MNTNEVVGTRRECQDQSVSAVMQEPHSNLESPEEAADPSSESVSHSSVVVSPSKPNMLMLDRDLILHLAEEHHLAITIRPDGLIIGFHDDLAKLRQLLEAQARWKENH